MTSWARIRYAVWLAGIAAIVPPAVAGLPTPSARPSEAGRFNPPSSPMLLTRTIRRPLPGGGIVISRRTYEIRIVAEGAGFRVDGELVEREVQAPPALKRLAALEMERSDAGMFPMRLDSEGQLLAREEPAAASEASHKAEQLALQHIAAAGLAPAEAEKAIQFVRQIATSSGRTAWPVDLFRPAQGHRQQSQTIPLANGAQGQVLVDIHASASDTRGLLASFTRKVTTQLGGDARVTEEIWTLVERS